MSSLAWLPRGLEQGAPPITQPLPVPNIKKYQVGGNRIIKDAVGNYFDPHFWLFELGTAKWRMGYDSQQKPVFEISLYQIQVFHVLLVDYWMPPFESWRKNQTFVYAPVTIQAQDAVPVTPVFTDAGGATTSAFTNDDAAITPTFSPG